MKLIILFLFVFCLQITHGQQIKPYHIQGHIKNLDNKMVYLKDLGAFYFLREKDSVLDSCMSNNGYFEFKGNISENMQCAIEVPEVTNQYLTFILEKGNISITGELSSLYRGKVEGIENSIFKQSGEIRRLYVPLINNLADSLLKYKDVGNKSNDFRLRYDSLISSMDYEREKFIKENPNAFASLLLINEMFLSNFSLNYIRDHFNVLSNTLKASPSGLIVQKRLLGINIKKNILKEFSGTDINGHIINSDKYKGKVTIIDFWASWCLPCIEKLPVLHHLNEKYGDRINILSISLDRNLKSWKKAVEHHNITWDNFCDGFAGRNPLIVELNIKAIPRIIVINKDGLLIYDSERDDVEVDEFMETIMEI